MQVGVKQYATVFVAAMGSLFAGSSFMHAVLKPDLVRCFLLLFTHAQHCRLIALYAWTDTSVLAIE